MGGAKEYGGIRLSKTVTVTVVTMEPFYTAKKKAEIFQFLTLLY